ncbi:MAG TPA: ThuA domain-containing protein [Agriterribacter sp.]|uniref:PVC-type heme-binding CxxCH protein n=1 Tax=Agriterribacter sp. TaxID=2821509 RepID=UPI002B718487|nr:PVC-type heme-binding CxxCH protein [Agriterribacter sp.]HRQ18831.1 ThuA domain-containing protein [Agriterribacter sp.]
MTRNILLSLLCIFSLTLLLHSCKQQEKDDKPRRLEILFLGHKSKHHDSEKLAELLSQEYFKKGINITYTTNPDDLLGEDMKLYDGLLLYANHDSITAPQEKALLEYVRSGKGFIPLHCASWCFRNSPEVVEMTGGQFKTHQYDSFTAVIVKPDHPVMKDVPAFSTEDETYVHDKISKDIEVLTERIEGDHREPYTWVRNYGEGRVFYTAYGHDEKTWMNPGFLKLVYNGIMWAVGDHAKSLAEQFDMPDPKYTDARMPNYEKRDPPPQFQEPLSPEQSMKLIQVPVGFEIQLFAAEPDINKPIYMNWDERGRLWIVETMDYPNMVRDNKEQGKDMIKILEDTDGDGRADKFTVFADKLNIPTSFAFINGGIVVAQAPDFLFLKDTDGDDKADVREKIISGWGTFDTHAGPSNFRYGPDNTIWGTVGYSGFKGVVGESKDTMRFSQGLYHFTADGKQLEFLGNTSNNTWGLGFSEDFDVFISTANNTHSAAYTIPKRYFEMSGQGAETGIDKIESHYTMHVVTKNLRQVDVHNGFTAAAGHSLYTARTYPKAYWNRIAFVSEPTGRVIHRNIIEPNGSTFKEGEDGWNFVASADDWFGPVQAEVGPDGNVWMLDWYNFIIQHNPTPQGYETGKGNAYINPIRDSLRGRIYSIRYKKGKKDKISSLHKKDTDGLINALGSPNMFWRTTAQRLLVESGDKRIVDKLYKIIENTSVDEIGLNAPAVHALWTLQGLKAFSGDNKEALNVAIGALKHPSTGVRRAAIQVLPATEEVSKALIEADIFKDKDLRVVLAAVLKACDLPASETLGEVLFKLASKEGGSAEDKWIQKALFIASGIQQQGFEKAFKASGISEQVELGKAGLIHRIMLRSKLNVLSLPQNTYIRPDLLPDLTGRELFFTANVELNNKDHKKGVIVAQGNKANGYAVYVDNAKKLHFQVNQNNQSYTIQSGDSVDDTFSVTAKLFKGGVMELLLNDKEIATGKAKGLFGIPLRDAGIRIANDYWNSGAKKAGNYEDSARNIGRVYDARMETLLAESQQADLGKPDQVIIMRTVQNEMKFEKTKITAKAGTILEIVLNNIDFMQHNLLVLKPGSMERVGAAADKLAQVPEGVSMQYIPSVPDVLFATPLVNPDQKFSLKFRVPDIPGDYPYICSYPGHWRIMNGVLTVVK